MGDNIHEIANRMTREEFLNWHYNHRGNYCPKELGISELYVTDNECDKYEKCSECIKEAVKDIKFKGEEETIAVICINPKKDLTLNKEYQVKQSKYTNMYELIDDSGHIDTYFKERFKIMEGEKVESIVKEKLREAIEKFNIDAEKEMKEEIENMEDKIIKVRCIDNGQMQQLALQIGKIYDAIESPTIKGAYQILIDDTERKNMNFTKNWFEKVEDVLIVECIDNLDYKDKLELNKVYKVKKEFDKSYSLEGIQQDYQFDKKRFKPVYQQKEVKCIWSDGTLELNKIYPVIREEKEIYIIKNDFREEKLYHKDNFEEVEEKKEYTFEEVVENIKPNEEYKSTREVFAIKSIKKGIFGELTFYHNGGFEYEMSNHIDQKFVKIEQPKPVTTVEAFKMLDEGKIIKSLVTNDEYFLSKNGDKKTLMIKNIASEEFRKCNNVYSSELEGLWIIKEEK